MQQFTQASIKLFLVLSLFINLFFKGYSQTTYFAGLNAGLGNTAGYNTAIGVNSLRSASSGGQNSAFGHGALFSNTTGSGNTAIGYFGLGGNTSGSYNVANGWQSMYINTTGTNNTANGYFSLYGNSTGINNTATGANALSSNGAGNNNTANGYTSLYNNSGSFNTSTGSQSLYSNTTGANNTSNGYQSLYFNTTGNNNAAFGTKALRSCTNGADNVAIGADALAALIVNGGITAIGSGSQKNSTGSNNTTVGYKTMNANTTGSYNTAIGYEALKNNIGGVSNTAIGESALFNTNASLNTGIGLKTLYSNTSGNTNTALGAAAMFLNTTGSANTSIGFESGCIFSLYNQCSFLGDSADASISGLTNAMALGFKAKVNASNKVQIGNIAVTSIGGQVGWTTFSDRRLKTNINKSKLGLAFILQLNPVTYNYKANEQKNIVYTGLIAQDVDAAAKKLGVNFSGVDKNGEYWGIRYAELTVPLIKATQEMNEMVKAVEKENQELKDRIEKLESFIIQCQNKTINDAKSQEQVILFQNQPNPFNQSTVIRYQLKNNNEKATIVIRNLNGSIVKQIAINQAGKGQAIINANEMAAGTYTYTLTVNGASVDTKLMVLIK